MGRCVVAHDTSAQHCFRDFCERVSWAEQRILTKIFGLERVGCTTRQSVRESSNRRLNKKPHSGMNVAFPVSLSDVPALFRFGKYSQHCYTHSGLKNAQEDVAVMISDHEKTS